METMVTKCGKLQAAAGLVAEDMSCLLYTGEGDAKTACFIFLEAKAGEKKEGKFVSKLDPTEEVRACGGSYGDFLRYVCNTHLKPWIARGGDGPVWGDGGASRDGSQITDPARAARF